MITVMIAEDQALIRTGFATLVEHEDDMQLIGEAANGVEAVAAVRREPPDVLLMDIRMPVMGGVEATALIRSDPSCAKTRILVLTTFDLDEYVYGALRAGASGFLLKEVEPDDLLRGVRLVARGGALLAPSVTQRLIADYARRGEPDRRLRDQLATLTPRELEVLRHVAAGLPNEDIAGQLFLSPLTVKTHIARMMTKLDAHSRAQLVSMAYEAGVAYPGHHHNSRGRSQ
jgi:DNA-binding NarL/FixJ family response regulator